jgi:hypothetical protein
MRLFVRDYLFVDELWAVRVICLVGLLAITMMDKVVRVVQKVSRMMGRR